MTYEIRITTTDKPTADALLRSCKKQGWKQVGKHIDFPRGDKHEVHVTEIEA